MSKSKARVATGVSVNWMTRFNTLSSTLLSFCRAAWRKIERSCFTRRPFVTAQQNRTDALRCSGDKYQAERTGSDPESDRLDCSFLSRRFTERGNHKVPCWTESTARVEVSNSGSCFQIQAWSFAIKIATRKQRIRH